MNEKNFFEKLGIKKDKEKELWNRIEEIMKRIENYIYPDSNPGEMMEAETIEKEKKEKLWELYKKLQQIKNIYLKYSLFNDKKAKKEFIKEAIEIWPRLEKTLKHIFECLEKKWVEEKKDYRREEYIS